MAKTSKTPMITSRTQNETQWVLLLAALVVLCTAASAQSGKYPLTLTAVYTAGHPISRTETTYRDGEYRCTAGDEHNAPVCKTDAEWFEQDEMTGTPDTALFTLADGSHIGVQSNVYHHNEGFLVCKEDVSESIFCHLLSHMHYMTNSGNLKSGGTATFHYKMKGKPKNGYQLVEVEEMKPAYSFERYGYDVVWLKK
jgi:hypothetical protein